MNIGNRIEDLMSYNDISQTQLARELNIALSTLNGYVKNKRQPNYDTLIELAKYFSVSCDYILGVETKNQPHNKEEMALLNGFKSLTEEQQELILFEINFLTMKNEKNQNCKTKYII